MGEKIDTVIQFSGLKSGKYTYDYKLGDSFFEEFENDELKSGNIDFEVILEKEERMLMFTFMFHGTVNTVCDRCLGEMAIAVEGEERLYVKFSDNETTDEEDIVYLPEKAYEIDLAQWMYEYVAVRIPMQKVHPEGECDPEMLKYISNESTEEEESDGMHKRENGDTDPRWDALKQMLEK